MKKTFSKKIAAALSLMLTVNTFCGAMVPVYADTDKAVAEIVSEAEALSADDASEVVINEIENNVSMDSVSKGAINDIEDTKAGNTSEEPGAGDNSTKEAEEAPAHDAGAGTEQSESSFDNKSDNNSSAPGDGTEKAGTTESSNTAESTDKSSETPSDNAAQQEETAEILNDQLIDLDELEPDEDYVSDELFFTAESEEEAQAVAEQYNAELSGFNYGVAEIKVEENVEKTLTEAVEAKEADTPVYVNMMIEKEDTEEVEISAVYSDPDLSTSTVKNGYQWYHTKIGDNTAWSRGITGSGVTVAVIDTGVDATHEDLKGKMAGGESVITGTDVNNYADDNGHGTNIAGIIAATAGNALGGAGIAPGAKIYAIKAANANGKFKISDELKAIKAATAKKVNIINMSFGGVGEKYGTSQYGGDKVQEAINEAVEAGILVIASACNNGVDTKSYPAAFDNVLAIGAENKNGSLAYYSNYGSWVDIAAPGWLMYAPKMGGGYGAKYGTSQAAAAASGLAALTYEAAGLQNDHSKSAYSKALNLITGNNDGATYTYEGHSIKGGISAKFLKAYGSAPQEETGDKDKDDTGSGSNVETPANNNSETAKPENIEVIPETGDTDNDKSADNKTESGADSGQNSGGDSSGDSGAATPSTPSTPATPSTPSTPSESNTDDSTAAPKVLAAKQKVNVTSYIDNESGLKVARYVVTPKGYASVNKKGVLTPKKSGTITVTAQAKDGKTYIDIGSYSVNIEVPVASKKKITSTKYGETIDAASLISGTTTLKPTSWSSSKSSVAWIDTSTGEITTAGRGSTKITAYYGEGKNAAKVSMTLKVNIPKLSKTSLTIKTGKTKRLSLKNAGGRSVTWGSLDRTVATVDGYGRVSAVAPGYTTVYAEVDGVRYECLVLVR